MHDKIVQWKSLAYLTLLLQIEIQAIISNILFFSFINRETPDTDTHVYNDLEGPKTGSK